MNVWAYKQDDFYTSPHAPACSEGNVGDGTVPLRPGELRWDRMQPFLYLADLVTGLRSFVQSGDPPHVIEMLAIMAHGMPGAVRMVPGELLNSVNLSTHGPRLRELNEIVRGGGRRSRPPLVLFMSCTAAAPPDGTRLFEGISNWMSGTRIVGFRTRLAMAEVTPRAVGGGRVCLPPDLRVTDEEYDPSRPIDAQGGSGVSASTLPLVQPRAHEAREFLDGRLVWEADADAEEAAGGSRGAFLRPTETHRGRGGGPRLA